jgi:penicillin-binding protein 1C
MKRLKKVYDFLFKKHLRKTMLCTLLLLVAYWFCLPTPLYNDPTSMVLEDKDGNLLGARIAADGQWRFPQVDTVPEKFAKAIIEFEDRRFYSHPGVDPIGIGRAVRQNIANKKIVSGGSTISMQVIRMARKGKSRNLFQKVIEVILATRLELKYSKSEILSFYASNAPFGGNVVGLDAASWRYYGKNAQYLSWSEAATLAVLPNSPALIHPGRNRQALFEKRNRLLDRLFENGDIDQLTCSLAKEETLPEKPIALPRLAPHLMDRAFLEHFNDKKNKKTRMTSTIDRNLQISVNRILNNHKNHLKENHIYNIATIVVEVETGNIIAYAGNVASGKIHHEQVDVIKAPRSTGSILKPFLYAMMLNEGTILPNSLISDVPTRMQGYNPKNFYETYDGVVSAKKAISRSLNVPLVRMLSDYGLEKFHFGLQKLGFSTINKGPDHYGLTLVLGGAEAKLEDITNAYTGMARTLNHFYEYNGKYSFMDFKPLNYEWNKSAINIRKDQLTAEPNILSAASIYQTFDAMTEVERPNSEGDWQQFRSSTKIAWKTGTSYGFRDAWAVGVTPKYAVGVWVGNADGEGRPGLIGVLAAAPILFDVFDQLNNTEWFNQPVDEMIKIPVCKQSGYRALPQCETDSTWIYKNGVHANPCPFHQIIHLDQSKKWRVNSECETPTSMVHDSWFVLPPLEEYYFKSKNPNYKILPPFRGDCDALNTESGSPMQMIYPKHKAIIYVPVDLNGKPSRTVFKLAHRIPETIVYWHLDNEYIGSTQHFHHMELQPFPGKHLLTIVDEHGNAIERSFEILEK